MYTPVDIFFPKQNWTKILHDDAVQHGNLFVTLYADWNIRFLIKGKGSRVQGLE